LAAIMIAPVRLRNRAEHDPACARWCLSTGGSLTWASRVGFIRLRAAIESRIQNGTRLSSNRSIETQPSGKKSPVLAGYRPASLS
jgi:hypothetical protein